MPYKFQPQAGARNLGIMPVTDRFGATPNTGSLSAYKIIRTHEGG